MAHTDSPALVARVCFCRQCLGVGLHAYLPVKNAPSAESKLDRIDLRYGED